MHTTLHNTPLPKVQASAQAASPPAGAASAYAESASPGTHSALRLITCGSVDDGKSTLIGRLLVDCQAVLQDHLAGVTRAGQTDLALLTDGLSAEREQGITIDVAYRYFTSGERKFILGDTPGHEQYTRNMVTAASTADAAVVLIDASKLAARHPEGQAVQLLPQTRRHALLAHLLRVPSIVFAINKLDAVPNALDIWQRTVQAVHDFAAQAGIAVRAVLPLSALQGWNVVHPKADWCDYAGPSLLQLLESLPTLQELAQTQTSAELQATPSAKADLKAQDAEQEAAQAALHLPVQWVEKQHDSAKTSEGRRIFWGRLVQGQAQVGQSVQLGPHSGAGGAGGAAGTVRSARIAQLLSATRQPLTQAQAGRSIGVVLDQELDLSRGDWITGSNEATALVREPRVTVAWMDEEALVPGRTYWALHGHRWVKARVTQIHERLDIHTLERAASPTLACNDIGDVQLLLQEPLPLQPYAQSRSLGSLILVDTATHRTAGAVLVRS